jgi:hypothetical protein
MTLTILITTRTNVITIRTSVISTRTRLKIIIKFGAKQMKNEFHFVMSVAISFYLPASFVIYIASNEQNEI